MAGVIANTVYGTISGTVVTISCAGSGTVVVSQDMARPAFAPLAPIDQRTAAYNMAFLGAQSSSLAPVLLAVAPTAANPETQKQLFVLPCEPAAQLDSASGSIGQHIAGGIRGVISVEPAQNFACVFGAHDVLLIQLDAHNLKIVRNFQCEFEIRNITASNWSIKGSNGSVSDDYITIVVTGGSPKEVAAISYLTTSAASRNSGAAAATSGNNNAKIRFENIHGLTTVADEIEEGGNQQQDRDGVTCQTLQSTNQSTPGAFVWWACWKSGFVTACHLAVPASINLSNGASTSFGVEAISPCQPIPELRQEPYVTSSGFHICASHTTNDVALWSSSQSALVLASAITEVTTKSTAGSQQQKQNQEEYPLVFARSSQIIRLQTPAVAARCIRGGTFLLVAGLYQNSQAPWTMAIPLVNKLSAHNLIASSSSSSSSSSPLELARALLSVEGSQLSNTVAEIEILMSQVENQLRSFQSITEESLKGIEKQLIQLRACRTAFNQREEMESFLQDGPSSSSSSTNRTNTRGRDWDRRLHVAFVLLHVTRLFVVATKFDLEDTRIAPIAQLVKERADRQASFLEIVGEALRIPRDLDEYTHNIQATWPARLVLQVAADHVGLSASNIVQNPMAQFQDLIQNSMESIDGTLEWVSFFALYLYGCGKKTPVAAINNFVNALKLPPCLLSLAKMARSVDTRYNNGNTEKITIKEASQLANQTSLPVRALTSALFSSLCDTGNLNAAYCMTSAMTVSTLLRGDKGAFERAVTLRLAFLAAEKNNLAILAVLLDNVTASLSQFRGPDDKTLTLYVISACARIAAKSESSFIFEGKLADVEDQNCALTQLAAFDAHKLRIELLVQLQRHAEALDAAEKFESKNSVEQSRVGSVASHLRAIVPQQDLAEQEQTKNRLMADGATSNVLNAFLKNNNGGGGAVTVGGNNYGDAEVVRPVTSAFYFSRSNYSENNSHSGTNNNGRCRVFMKKSGMECGSQVPCPYHSASSQHSVALN